MEPIKKTRPREFLYGVIWILEETVFRRVCDVTYKFSIQVYDDSFLAELEAGGFLRSATTPLNQDICAQVTPEWQFLWPVRGCKNRKHSIKCQTCQVRCREMTRLHQACRRSRSRPFCRMRRNWVAAHCILVRSIAARIRRLVEAKSGKDGGLVLGRTVAQLNVKTAEGLRIDMALRSCHFKTLIGF